MNLPPPPPPPQDDDPIITQFRPVQDQWELNDDNINRIDPETGQTILHNYCQCINTTPLAVYQYLIEVKGCDVNARDNNKDTPLRYALFYFNPNYDDDITVLTYLLSQKSFNHNIKDRNSFTLLHWACTYINKLPIELFKLLIETFGYDVNAQDKYKDTPLHNALRDFYPNDGGDISILQYLFSQTNIHVNTKGHNGETLLHYTCKNINKLPLDIFKVLIETHGADVNVQDDNNKTPVHNALDQFHPRNGGDITVLAYLLNQNNVNLNIKNEKGYNRLHHACTNNLPSYRRSVELDAEYDTVFCQIVEFIAERCVQQVLGETNME